MKKYYFRFRFALITFAFGLASVWFFSAMLKTSDEVLVDLPKTQTELPIIVFTETAEEIEGGFYQPLTVQMKRGNFYLIGAGCRENNCFNSFVSFDRKVLSVSVEGSINHIESDRKFKEEISKAKYVIQNLDFAAKGKRKVERIILAFDYKGKDCVNILWKAEKDKYYTSIFASNMQTAVDVETYLNKKPSIEANLLKTVNRNFK